MHTPDTRITETSEKTPATHGRTRSGAPARFFRTALAAVVLAGAPAREAGAQQPAPSRRQVEELKGVVDDAQRELQNYRVLQQKVAGVTDRLDASDDYDPDVALELTILRIALQTQGTKIERNERIAREVHESIAALEAKIDLAERKELAFYTREAAGYAGNVSLWNAFGDRARRAFAQYEQLRATPQPTAEQAGLLRDMRLAIDVYRKPAGMHDAAAIGASLTSIARLERLMGAFERTGAGALTLDIPDGGTIRFTTDDGRVSPEFTVDSRTYDVYPFGAATLERRGSAWLLLPDPSFSGTVSVRGAGGTMTEYRIPSNSPALPKGNRAAPATEARPTQPARPFRAEAPRRRASEQYAQAQERFRSLMLADRARKGGSPAWQAYHQEFQQAMLDFLAEFGGNHPDDIDPSRWSSFGISSSKCQPIFDRMNAILDGYERDRATLPDAAPSVTPAAGIGGMDLVAAMAEIESAAERIRRENGGELPAAYAEIDGLYRGAYDAFLNEEPLNPRLIAYTLANWRQAARLHELHASAPAGSADRPASAMGALFNAVTSGAAFSPDMDSLTLRRQLITESARREFTIARTPAVLQALLRMKEAMPDILGADGVFLKGDIGSHGLDVLAEHAHELEGINPDSKRTLSLISTLTRRNISSGMTGGVNGESVDWFLAAFNAPVPLKGMPDGIILDIRDAEEGAPDARDVAGE